VDEALAPGSVVEQLGCCSAVGVRRLIADRLLADRQLMADRAGASRIGCVRLGSQKRVGWLAHDREATAKADPADRMRFLGQHLVGDLLQSGRCA